MAENSIVTLKQEVVPTIVGRPFYNTDLPTALGQAQKYASKKGYVATMPHLLLNFPHDTWFTANSEDLVGIDTEGLFGPRGEAIVLTYHGGGILASHPARIKKAYKEKLTPQYAAKLTEPEFSAALRGEVVSQGKATVYNYGAFLEESVSSTFLEDHPVYGIVRPFKDAQAQPSGDGQKITDLVNHTQVIVYVGGKQRAAEAMERAAKRYTDGKLAVWHPFNTAGFGPAQPQGRLLFLKGNPVKGGLSGDDYLYDCGRFVGVVAPELAARQVPNEVTGAHRAKMPAGRAEKVARPTLEQVLRASKKHISPARRKDFKR